MIIGIVGSGTWAVALAKVLAEKEMQIRWWIRNTERNIFFKNNGYHKDYLPDTKFAAHKAIYTSTCVKEVFEGSEYILLCLPSAFIASSLSGLKAKDWQDKKIISASKGLITDDYLQLQVYLHQVFEVDINNYVALTGPSHAEEVAIRKYTFLTCCHNHYALAKKVRDAFENDYLKVGFSTHLITSQYAAVLKNVYAIAIGIMNELCQGGDNFKSVIITNAIREFIILLKKISPSSETNNEDFIRLEVVGDLLVTCYSEHSRNRRFGKLIAQGIVAEEIIYNHKIIAEGYFATKWLKKLAEEDGAIFEQMHILNMLLAILYGNKAAQKAFDEVRTFLI